MARYIDADELLKRLQFQQKYGSTQDSKGRAKAILEVIQAPTADVEPVRHGRWEWEPGYVGTEARCSVCKRSPSGFYSLPISQIGRLPEYPFCPKCGAKMDGDTE